MIYEDIHYIETWKVWIYITSSFVQ